MKKRILASGAALFLVAGVSRGADARVDSVLASQVITTPTLDERTGQGLVTIDVTGIPSMDRLRSPNNVVLYVWVGPFNVVNGGGYDVWLQTEAPGSRLSDIGLGVTNTAAPSGPGFGFLPGAMHEFPGGPTNYTRLVRDLSPNVPTVTAMADGFVRIEFFDEFDESSGQPDGRWVSGTVTLQTQFPIPTPVSPGTATVLALSMGHAIRRGRR